MLKNFFAAVRREQQIVTFFDDVRDVRKRWIKCSYKWYAFRFVEVFGLLSDRVCGGCRRRVVLGKRLDTMSSDSKISECAIRTSSTRYRIPWGLFFLPLWRADSKYPDSLPNLRAACGWKPYPERKSCGFKSIRIRVDGG